MKQLKKGMLLLLSLCFILTACQTGEPGSPPDSQESVVSGTETGMKNEDKDTENAMKSDQYFQPYQKRGHEVDVTAYGAVGDGVTDDSNAIKDAAKAAKEKGGVLYFPAGTYYVTEMLGFTEEYSLGFAADASLYQEQTLRISSFVKAGNDPIFQGPGSVKGTIQNEYCNPVWFGAKGDGKTDDTEAFRKAIATKKTLYIPYSSDGYVVGDLELTATIRIVGISSEEGERTRLIGKSGIKNLFALKANSIIIENIDIDMANTEEAVTFFFDTSLSGRNDYLLRDMEVTGAWRVVGDAGVITNYVTNSLVDNVNCINNRGTSFYLECFWGFVFFRDLIIDNSGTEAAYGVKANFPAVQLENNAGCVFQRMKVIGDGNALNTQGHGFKYNNNIATWMDNCEFENISGNCVLVTGSNSHLYFSNLTASGCRGNSFTFNTTFSLQVHNVVVDASDAFSTSNAGMVFNQVTGSQITNCTVTSSHGDGIILTSCNGMSISQTTVIGSKGIGINAAASQGVTLYDCTFSENQGGDTTLSNSSGIVEKE